MSSYYDYDLVSPSDAMPEETGCSEWAIGFLCGKSDCAQCGHDVAQDLRHGARQSWSGMLALVREVVRLQEEYGNHVPADTVTPGDVANAISWHAFGCGWRDLKHAGYVGAVFAWADGIIDAEAGKPMPQTAAECLDFEMTRWCYFLGRASLSIARLGTRLRERRESETAARRWHGERMVGHRVAMAEQAVAL